MSRIDDHVHGSRRLHRALGLGLSGLALVGLVYFEGSFARAEAEDAGTEELEDEAELDEAEDAEGGKGTFGNSVPSAAPLAPVDAVAPTAPAAEPVPAATAVDGRLAMADVAAVDAAAALPVAPPAPALVAVPDIEGMSVRKAKKQLAAVGLKLAVRDESGWKVPREFWGDYKVRSQKIDAGTEETHGLSCHRAALQGDGSTPG